MNSFLVLCLFLASLGHSSALTLQPPENQYTQVSSEATLMCHSSHTIQSCTWTTPYEAVIPLKSGQKSEQGRLKHTSKDETKDCGIIITKVEEKDYGQWSCTVAVVENGEVTTANGQSFLFKATKPESVAISAPTNNGSLDIDGSGKEIACKVSNARPEPQLNWYVGEEELVGYETRGSLTKDSSEATPSFTQILVYHPKKDHANQTLRCVVDHMALEQGEKMEASVYLQFPSVVDDTTFAIKEVPPQESSNSFSIIGLVAAGVILVFVAIGSACLLKKRFVVRRNVEEVDESKVQSKMESQEDKADGVSSNGDASVANDDQAALSPKKTKTSGPKFSERVAPFFRWSKGTEAVKETQNSQDTEDEKETKEDKEETPVKTEEIVLDMECTEEKDEETPAENDAEIAPKEGKPKRGFTSIFHFFKKDKKAKAETEESSNGSDTSEEPEKAKADEKETEKSQADEEETEKTELEPEDKEPVQSEEEAPKKILSDTPV